MPTDVRFLRNVLDNATCFSDLGAYGNTDRIEKVRSGVLQILETIHHDALTRERLKATKLRRDARMDTHRYGLIMKWLQKCGYCTSTRVTETKSVGPHERVRIRSHKQVTLTESGKILLNQRQRVTRVKTLALDLYRALTSEEEMDFAGELVVEAFVFAFVQFYFYGKTDVYDEFRGTIENDIREHLNADIGDKRGLIYDAYLVVKRIRQQVLLEDARKARAKGHYLTPNHEYILRRTKEMKEKDVAQHNTRWIDRKYNDEFNPESIVEEEREERSGGRLERQPTIFVRDSFDYQKWNPYITKREQTQK